MAHKRRHKAASISHSSEISRKKLHILFLHPDLGIGTSMLYTPAHESMGLLIRIFFCEPGGAERLVVDAAMALRQQQQHVHLCTSHHDASHCFKETVDGSLSISVSGDWLPRSILGKGHVLCAWIRSIYLACFVIWQILIGRWNPDLFFVDQISIAIPLLKLTNRKVNWIDFKSY
jgi:alpha-1,3/alpha-1,6-mannosyltransferase